MSEPSLSQLESWMDEAQDLAQRAAEEGEIPVGALLIRGERVVARGWNRSAGLLDPTAHAEIQALRRAAAVSRNYRLPGSVLVTTLEPCVMCFGALLEARVGCLVFGAADSRRGGVGLWKSGSLRRYPVAPLSIVEGVHGARCRAQLLDYFAERRAVP